MKTIYTKEQTAAYIAARNEKRTADKLAKKNRPVLVHLAKHSNDYYEKFGIMPKGKTFRGSVRMQFTGISRNNIV